MEGLKQTLPVTYLLFTWRGRISRSEYWHAVVLVSCSLYILFHGIEFLFGAGATWILYPLYFWSMAATSSKRLHDSGRSGYWLAWSLIPVFGPLYLVWLLFLRGGIQAANEYGAAPGSADDYLKNDSGQPVSRADSEQRIINDVTQLNPVVVKKVLRPESVDEICSIIRESVGPISVGGGRFSMGGQTASPESIHLDLRGLNKVLDFSMEDRWIKVEAGIRWCDIQRHIDPHDLSVKIMQSYANFTVGGSLSVNSHGRYMGLGPLILSVRSIDVVLPDGSLIHASQTENSEIFFGAIGGYNGIGIIVVAELDLEVNTPVRRVHRKMPIARYVDDFLANVRPSQTAVFHNADIYPPDYARARSVTWEKTTETPTVPTRLMPLRQSYPFHRYLLWAFSETPLGRWRREFVIEPLLYLGKRIHWRNYEAGYDVAELEPGSRANSTYVLLEYFVPIGKFMEFAVRLAEIFKRHRVMVMNISIRHANADPGTLLAWAREEVFAFVVYYKQGVTEVDRIRVGVWNRELIDAVISVGGTYYLPYQPHATSEQFHRAYPGAKKLFDLKARLDPDNRFRNAIWDKYYQPTRNETMSTTPSEFKTVFNDTSMKDGFYRFLQVVFHLYPEDRFHHLIAETCKSGNGDSDIYNSVQERLPEIKTFLSELTYALPALRKQKREMTRQTLKLLGDRKQINGYLEIGSTGRYISDLRKHVRVSGEIFLINDVAPDNSIGEIFERGQISRLGTFLDLAEYAPIDAGGIPDASIDLATCFIGFHHCPEEKLEAFVKSIARALRPGGSLIVRDHNVKSKDMATFVSLVHTVFNLGLGIPWDTNSKEYRSFRSIDDWCKYICGLGFTDSGERLYQENDPSDNALVILTKN